MTLCVRKVLAEAVRFGTHNYTILGSNPAALTFKGSYHKYKKKTHNLHFTNTHDTRFFKFQWLKCRQFRLLNYPHLWALFIRRKDEYLYFISFHNILKSIAFMSGGVQKDLDSKHLLRHSASYSWSLPYLITSLFMQALTKSSSCDQSFLLRSTCVFSLVMRIYRPQYTDSVCWVLPSSCNSFLRMSPLNVTRMDHCISFNTTWPEGVPIFSSV